MFGVQNCQVVSSLQKYMKKENNTSNYDFAENNGKFYVIQGIFPHGSIDKRCWTRLHVSAHRVNLDACILKTSPEEYES